MINFIKAVACFIALILTAAYFSIKVLFRWGDTNLNREFNYAYARIANKIVGIDLTILNAEGMSAHRPAVLIGNHQTGLDFALIGALCPPNTVVIGKREIIYIPFLGWFLLGAGNILINRTKTREARSALLSAIAIMKSKNLDLAIMPEGTRNRGDTTKLLPFKKGAFNLAIEGQLPIIPTVCSSLEGIAILERKQLNGGKVILSVLPPVETKGLTLQDANRLAEEVRAKMQAELDRINAMIRKDKQP